MQEASKALDIEMHTYEERLHQINDELSWLVSDDRIKFRLEQAKKISEQIEFNDRAKDGRSARLADISTKLERAHQEYWNDAVLENTATVYESIERIRSINTGAWAISDAYYTDPIRRLTGIQPGQPNFGNFAAYYMAGAMRWLYARDGKLSELGRGVERDHLAVQELGIKGETASLKGRQAALEEDDANLKLRQSQLKDARKRLEMVYERPGFSFADRLLSIVEESFVIVPLLHLQSTQFARVLDRRIAYAFEPFPDIRTFNSLLSLERTMAKFRAQLSQVSAVLDRIAMTGSASIRVASLTLIRDGSDLAASAILPARSARGRIKEILVRGSEAYTWGAVRLSFTGPSGEIAQFDTVIAGSEQAADMDLTLRGLDLESIDLPATVVVRTTSRNKDKELKIDLICRMFDYDA